MHLPSNSQLPSSPGLVSHVILGASLMLGIAFYICFWNQQVGLAMPIFVSLLIGTTWWITTRLLHRPAPREIWAIAAVAMYLSLMLAWRNSVPILLLNLATLLGLSLCVVWRLAGRTFLMRPSNFLALLLLPLSWIKPFLITASRALLTTGNTHLPKSASVMVGLVIATPLTVVLLALFASVDPNLGLLLSQFLTPFSTIQGDWPAIIFIIALVSLLMAAAYSFIVHSHHSLAADSTDRSVVGPTESHIILGMINAVFLLYLILQSVYLFGGQTYLDTTATTYADYARSGFGQLIMTALIALGALWLTKPHLSQLNSWTARLGTSLIAQVAIVLISAVNRLWLYEQAYGFTIARLIGYAIAAWLGLVLVILLVQITMQLSSRVVGPALISAAVAVVIALNLLNPEALIAQQNIQRYHHTGKIDVAYLFRLSTDATPHNVQLVHDRDHRLANTVKYYLQTDRQAYSQQQFTGWQSWNWSRIRAQQILDQQDLLLSPDFKPTFTDQWQ